MMRSLGVFLFLGLGIYGGEVAAKCPVDDRYDYIVDYFDDRSMNDIPDNSSEITSGFMTRNAHYIGEEALNKMDFTTAELCAVYSKNCSMHCQSITDANKPNCTCSLASGLNTPLKQVIGALAGLCDGQECINWDAAGIMNDSDPHFKCDESDFRRISRWGEDVQWHVWGWGLTLFRSSRGGWEFGYHPDNNCSSKPDYDRLIIRTMKKEDAGDTSDKYPCDICSRGTTLLPWECAVRNSEPDGSGEEVYEGAHCMHTCQDIYDGHMSYGVTPEECGNIQGHYTGTMGCCVEGADVCPICSRGTSLLPDHCAVRNSEPDGSGEEVYEGGHCMHTCKEINDEHMRHIVSPEECGSIEAHYTGTMGCCAEPDVCSICSPGTTLVPDKCAVRNSEPDGSGEEVYEGGHCMHTCQDIYDGHMSYGVTPEECGNIQGHYTGTMGCCVEGGSESKCGRIKMDVYDRLVSKGWEPVTCDK